jgi:hypothetical protein
VVDVRNMITWRRLLLVSGALLLSGAVLATLRTVSAAHSAEQGRADLERATAALRSQDLDTAHEALVSAMQRFESARERLRGFGGIMTVAREVPLVRVQLRGLDGMSEAGVLISRAGLHLTDAAGTVLDDSGGESGLSGSIPKLRLVRQALGEAASTLHTAALKTRSLDRYRLFGRLGSTRDALEAELARAQTRTSRAEQAVGLLLWTVGADGPNRLLIVSQNPDEVRPGGGYLGTYGVLEARAGHVVLSSYSAMGPWVSAHPQAVIPVGEAPSVFHFARQDQELPNANATPDWPTSAGVLMELWERGGEMPANGVLSLSPQTMARIVSVLGPVNMSVYGEVVTGRNLIDRVNHYTHRAAVLGESAAARKQFVVDLAHTVVQRMLHAPSSSWLSLGRAIGDAFDAGESVMWSPRAPARGLLDDLGWQGALPATVGDFYAEAEFAFASKNGSDLRRTFTHVVDLRADGSGTATTTTVVRDTAPFKGGGINEPTYSYFTPYGPRFSTSLTATPTAARREPSLAGHPSAGWLLPIRPLRSTTLRVSWDSQVLARPMTDGSLQYRLEFRGQPAHDGDILRLVVHPPSGWDWVGRRPPSVIHVTSEFIGTWRMHHVG